jgi:hypothetical protein
MVLAGRKGGQASACHCIPPEKDGRLVSRDAVQGAAAADHPLVKRTIELFNAKLVGVQPRKTKE